jgi:FkbM family methyltransferase
MSSLTTILDEIRNFEPVDLLSGPEPLLIYGAGGFGRDVARALLQLGRPVLGFLDRGGATEVEGLPCRHPEADLQDWLEQGPTVLVGLHNHKVDPLPVRNQVRALGFPRVHLPVEYHRSLERELGPRYWLGRHDLYRRHFDELQAVFALLTDEKSRALFLSTLEYRALCRPESQPDAEPEQAYFPIDLPRWPEPLNWVDGGACDGDTLRSFPLDRYRCAAVYAFEPDLKNFAILQTAIDEFKAKSPSTHIASWPCGLGSENALLKFKTGLGLASAASSEGDTECPIKRLDSVLPDSPVNLIKLDVEGAEPEALLGAQQIIREQHPGLAICIYHTPGHLWEIPIEIARRHPGYRFYLRSHGQSSFDLVLYAM